MRQYWDDSQLGNPGGDNYYTDWWSNYILDDYPYEDIYFNLLHTIDYVISVNGILYTNPNNRCQGVSHYYHINKYNSNSIDFAISTNNNDKDNVFISLFSNGECAISKYSPE